MTIKTITGITESGYEKAESNASDRTRIQNTVQFNFFFSIMHSSFFRFVLTMVFGNFFFLHFSYIFKNFEEIIKLAMFSSAHVLGEAMERVYGGHLCYGPPIEQGFYYDMHSEEYKVTTSILANAIFYSGVCSSSSPFSVK